MSMKGSYSFVKPGLRGRTLWSSWFKTVNASQRIGCLTAFPPLFQNHRGVLYRLHICWFSTGKERWGVTRTSRWQQCSNNAINADGLLRNVISMKSTFPCPSLKTNMLWMLVGLMFWNGVRLFFDSADVQVHGIFVFQVCMQIKWVLKLLRCCWKTSDTMAAWTNSCRTRWVWERERERHTHTLCDLTLTLLWLSYAAHYLHGAGKGNVSDSNWCCDTTHTDSNSHRRAADSGQKLLQHETRPMVPFLFTSHSSSFNIASLSCPGLWRSASGHPRVCLSRADQSLTLCAVVFAGKVHNNKVRGRAEQKHHLHHRMSRIRSGEPQPVAEHAVHTLTPRSVAAPNMADPLSFCLSGFFHKYCNK